ncbi:hypothetical protein CHS0354_017067 [Potamilus streckersoni]|nr:hypothetical protein CHS0354_017067 [Potamilus streckersoni]
MKNFTKTQAFHQAVDILRNKGVLILSGGPGEGKTTTAANILLHTSTPEKCLVVRSPDEFKHVDPLSFDVIFIDNMFGEINVNIEWVNKWLPYLEDMMALVREKKTSFIIALREHIFENCKIKLQRTELFKPEFCHRLSSVDLSDAEKAMILERYLLDRNRLWTKDFINDCVQNHSGLLGFPACAELFAANDYLYSVEGPKFFNKPLNFLKKCLETLYGDREEEFLPFALLWIMHNRNKKLTKDWLSSGSSRCILESLDIHGVNSRSLEKSYSDHSVYGGFIRYSKVDGSYEFGHPAVKDMVGMMVMRMYPRIALQECNFEFIMEYLCVSERASDEVKYTVEPWLHSCLADRFIDHAVESFAKHRHSFADTLFRWLGHEILEDTLFIATFVERVKERGKIDEIFGFSKSFFLQFIYGQRQRFEHISIFSCALSNLFYEHSDIENVVNVQFAEQIIRLGILDEVSNKEFIASQKTIALLFGLRSRKMSFVQKIIESGAVADSNCLCMAVYHSYFDIVRNFIEEMKVDINGKAEMVNGSTALCIAAKTGNRDMIIYLIKHGASINVIDMYNVSPLGRTLMNWHEDVAEILIDHGADIFLKMSRLQKTPLHLSAERGLSNVVKVLLKKGASTAKRDRRGHTPLHYAAMNGHSCVVNILLQHDISQVNKRAFSNTKKSKKGSGIRGVTALHYAARQGYVDVADIVIQAGGEVDIKDSFGQTPLYVASNFGHLDIVRLLVSKGANVNITENHGFTPSHVAVYRQRSDVVKFLAERATIDALDKYGKTPLHIACQKGYTDLVKLLLAHNSNWRLSTYTDNTVLHYACRYGHAEIAKEFASRDKEMLCVKNSKTTRNPKVPFIEALIYSKTEVITMLKSMKLPDPSDLYNEELNIFFELFQ